MTVQTPPGKANGRALAYLAHVSAASPVQRSTELRVQSVVLDGEAQRMVWDVVARGLPLRFTPTAWTRATRRNTAFQALEVRLYNHLRQATQPQVAVTDASEFSAAVPMCGVRVGPHGILWARGSSVPNTLAAVLLWVRDQTGMPLPVYFE